MPEYGNLLSYEEAVACAPEGWRLPTDEDWQALERLFGMSSADTRKRGWRGNGVSAVMQEGEDGNGLNLKMGGGLIYTASYGLELAFMHFKGFGYYWTYSIDEAVTEYEAAFYSKLCFSNSKVERQSTKTNRYFSVRYVRDVN